MTDRFILRIDPPQPCLGHYPTKDGAEEPCTLFTSLAETEHESQSERQLRVSPYCWRHLYIAWPDPGPEEPELEHLCIPNFVINSFGGKGTVEVLGPCPTDSIPPPYEPWEDDDMIDEASSVTSRAEQARSGMCVLFTSCGRTVGNCSSLPKVAWNAHRSE